MEVRHRISFSGGKEYEQHEGWFILSEADIPSGALNGCNLMEKMFVFNVLVLFEGLLFQYCEGYIDAAELKKRKERIFGLLSDKLTTVVKNLMRSSGKDE